LVGFAEVTQAEILFDTEADAWLNRNRARLGTVDRVSDAIEQVGLIPNNVLEIGCSNGWRLARLKQKFGCNVLGIDPGRRACSEARMQGVHTRRGTANQLPTLSGWADIVIYGFCLYLADPCDWLQIAAEGDRVLRTNGHLIIHDFAATSGAYAVKYEHDERLRSYHFDFASMWASSPLYSLILRKIYEDEMVTVLKKRSQNTIEVRE
jgi:SAM-dependent methyltransferase